LLQSPDAGKLCGQTPVMWETDAVFRAEHRKNLRTELITERLNSGPVMVAHSCNPNNLGGKNCENQESEASQGKKFMSPHFNQ
jgi:hypothetical protein